MLDTIKGEVKIFAREVKYKKKTFMSYSVCIGSKKDEEEDTYINCYVPVAFSKKVDTDLIENGTDVLIQDAWFTPFEDKDGYIRPKLFINKCKVVENDEDEEDEDEEDEKPVKKSSKGKKVSKGK